MRRFPPKDDNGNLIDVSSLNLPFDREGVPLTEDEKLKFERLKRNLMIEMAQHIGDVYHILQSVPSWLTIRVENFLLKLRSLVLCWMFMESLIRGKILIGC